MKMASPVQQEISWIVHIVRILNLWISRRKKKQYKFDNQLFYTVHHKRHRFHALLKHVSLKTYQHEYWMDRNSQSQFQIESCTSVVHLYLLVILTDFLMMNNEQNIN